MERRHKKTIKSQSGFALVIALIIMAVLTLIGLALTFSSTLEVRMSGNKRGSTNAFYAADSGIQEAADNVQYFDKPSGNTTDQWQPALNPNPTHAEVTILYDPNRKDVPRGIPVSAIHFDFSHYTVEAIGNDQIAFNLIKSKSVVQQKMLRLMPTLQGGY